MLVLEEVFVSQFLRCVLENILESLLRFLHPIFGKLVQLFWLLIYGIFLDFFLLLFHILIVSLELWVLNTLIYLKSLVPYILPNIFGQIIFVILGNHILNEVLFPQSNTEDVQTLESEKYGLSELKPVDEVSLELRHFGSFLDEPIICWQELIIKLTSILLLDQMSSNEVEKILTKHRVGEREILAVFRHIFSLKQFKLETFLLVVDLGLNVYLDTVGKAYDAIKLHANALFIARFLVNHITFGNHDVHVFHISLVASAISVSVSEIHD